MANMAFVKSVFNTVSDGLLVELDTLSLVAGGGEPRFLIWSAGTPALTLPERFSRQDGFPQAAEWCAANGWPVTTRRTGGGITPQGPGVLNVALAFTVPRSKARSVTETYGAICNPLIDALAQLGITAKPGSVEGSFCDGDFNLEVNGRKIVGTAQRWRGPTVLCHALILTDIDLAPAVTAAQQLADGLDLGHRYHLSRHTSLAELASELGEADLTKTLVDILTGQGFAPAPRP